MLMTCRHVNQLRDVYLDGELSPSLTAEVHAHTLQCPSCQQQFEMMRACADLIAKDRPEPSLDSGFASRIVASLPARSSQPVLMTRRDARQRFWRIFAGAGLPAAAAMLFLSVLIWPTTPARSTGIVLPAHVEATDATGVSGIVNPAIDTIRDTHATIQNVVDTVVVSVGSVGKDLDEEAATTTQPASLLDVFLSPFKDALTPIASDETTPDDDKEIVRF